MEEKLLSLALQNKFIPGILDATEKAGLPDWYLSAGCITETVWNSLHGFPLEFGIKDYDIVYFNSEKKDELEKVDFIMKANPEVEIEVVNQAFVHTWFKEYFGYEIPPFLSTEESMAKWGSPVSAVGIKKENGKYKVFAPFGVEDIFNMVVRPNESSYYISDLFNKKAHNWKEKWPKLNVIMPNVK